MPILLVRTLLPNVNGIAKDTVDTSFVLQTGGGSTLGSLADAITAVSAFWKTANTHYSISSYLSLGISRVTNMCSIETYDITTHLDGTPHGSPIDVEMWTPDSPPSGTGNLPFQAAAVASYHSDMTGLFEHGPMATRSSPESAVDLGAPATHSAKTRPKASHRGRIYVGPLNDLADNGAAGLTGFIETDLKVALIRLASTLGWVVWSRVLASVSTVVAGWIDEQFGAVRRRRLSTGSKIAWP